MVTTPYWFGERIGHVDIAVACALRFVGEAHPALFDTRYPALQSHAISCETLPEFREIVQPLAPPKGSGEANSRKSDGLSEAKPIATHGRH